MKTQYKPSDIHSNPELHKKAADAANRKRKERQEELRRQENIKQREEYRRKQKEEQEKQEREEQERIRKEQEEKMWQEAKKEKTEPKKGLFGKKIKTEVDGKEFDSLAKAMAWIDPVNWSKENDYRTSCWIKINRTMKKNGECEFQGHTYKLI